MSILTIAGFATVALVLVMGGVLLWRRADTEGARATPNAPQVTRLAVLPFEHLGRPEDAYITDGLTDEIRGRLSSVPGVQVIARASSNEYRRTTKSPRAIAAELGVRYLLTGTVRSEPAAAGQPARVRVSPELVEITSGNAAPVSRWNNTLDASMADVFAMQADIAGRVAGAMNVALGGEAQAQLAEVPTRSPEAYDAFLRGEAVSNALSTRNPTVLRQALEHYTRAVTLDSGFALGWAQRSRAATYLYFNSVPSSALKETSRASAERALALEPRQAAGHLALGDYLASIEVDYSRALPAYEQGRRVAPRDADLLAAIAGAEQSLGRNEEAVRDMQVAVSIDPRSASSNRRLGTMLLWSRRYAEARAAFDRTLALAPTNQTALQDRTMVEVAEGNLDAARRVLANLPPTIDRQSFLMSMGNYWDMYWVLSEADQSELLTLPVSVYDGDRATWAWVRSQVYALRGDSAHARAYADTGRAEFEVQLRESPNDGQRLVMHGLILTTLGRGAEGIAEAERGAAVMSVSRDHFSGSYLQHQLARAYLAGGKPERAIDILEALLSKPYYLSRAWLRVDPQFAPLRSNPRFQRLLAGEPTRV